MSVKSDVLMSFVHSFPFLYLAIYRLNMSLLKKEKSNHFTFIVQLQQPHKKKSEMGSFILFGVLLPARTLVTFTSPYTPTNMFTFVYRPLLN